MSAQPKPTRDDFPDSPYAAELRRKHPRLRFAPAVEAEYARFNLARSRGRIRAWHTTVLVVLSVAVLPTMVAVHFGSTLLPGGTWAKAATDPFTLTLAFVVFAARATLTAVAWSSQFERIYPRIVLPLALVLHGGWAFICGSEVFGPHPEFLAPLVTDGLAAFFFTGLALRSALLVNVAAVAGVIAGGLYFDLAPELMLAYAPHMALNLIMAGIAGLALERFSRTLFLEHSQLAEAATRDPLTGLKNRRAFDEHLRSVWSQAFRDRRSIAVLMLDVDHFKAYNDCYGHQAGDQTLVRIAATLQRAGRRPLDIVARYGGEELVLVLYDLDPQSVRGIAEQLTTSIRDMHIGHRASPTSPFVTVSIGVAIARPASGRSPEGAVQLADEAMYSAKHAGRNCICVLEAEYEMFKTGTFRPAPLKQSNLKKAT